MEGIIRQARIISMSDLNNREEKRIHAIDFLRGNRLL